MTREEAWEFMKAGWRTRFDLPHWNCRCTDIPRSCMCRRFATHEALEECRTCIHGIEGTIFQKDEPFIEIECMVTKVRGNIVEYPCPDFKYNPQAEEGEIIELSKDDYQEIPDTLRLT